MDLMSWLRNKEDAISNGVVESREKQLGKKQQQKKKKEEKNGDSEKRRA